MKYKKAEYKKIMLCPECNYYDNVVDDNMSDSDCFVSYEDDDGVEYYQCPCGCQFVK